MFLWIVEGSGDFYGGQGEWIGAGDAGHADPEDAGTAADARVWDRDAHRADQQRRVPGESGVAISGVSQAGARGMAGQRVAGDGEQSASEILCADRAGAKAIEGRDAGMGAAGGGDCADFGSGVVGGGDGVAEELDKWAAGIVAEEPGGAGDG